MKRYGYPALSYYSINYTVKDLRYNFVENYYSHESSSVATNVGIISLLVMYLCPPTSKLLVRDLADSITVV